LQLQVGENVHILEDFCEAGYSFETRELTVEFEAESALAGLKSIKYISIFIFPCLSENICTSAKVGPIK